MKKYLKIIVAILIPNIIGLISFILADFNKGMEMIEKPSYTPPPIVFPIVWVTLFTLMGISSYLIYKSDHKFKKNALILYFVQLIVNAIYSPLFFKYNLFLYSFFLIIILIVLVMMMLILFKEIDKRAYFLNLPYLLWLVFAAFLNYNIFLLN